MIELEEAQKKLNELNNKINIIGDSIKITEKETSLKELESKTLEQNFWNDTQNSGKVLSQIKSLKVVVANFNKIKDEINNLLEMIDLVLTENDEFKPGFFDEEDDEFFQSLDEERKNHYEEYEKRNQMEIISNTSLPNQVIKIELNADGSVKKISKEFKD